MKFGTSISVVAVLGIGVLGGCLAGSGDLRNSSPSGERQRPVKKPRAGAWGSDNRANSVNRIERLHWEDAVAIKIPISDDLVELGRTTYNTRCLICHGQVGCGNGSAANYLDTKPRDFTKAIFKYRTTPQGSFPRDEDLFRSISVGFPIYGMPSFRYLSARQRWGLVYYVKKLTKKGFRRALKDNEDVEPDEVDEILAEKLKPGKPVDVGQPPAETAVAVAAGKNVYEELSCAKCHGASGMGDGPSSDGMVDEWGNKLRAVPFAANPYFMKAGGRPRDIVRVLMTGVGGTGMPRFDRQNPDDYWTLAYYVLQLAHELPQEN